MSKLWKVCDVVRQSLGLDNITFQYDAYAEKKTLTGNAALGTTHIVPRGAKGLIDFWSTFFNMEPWVQLSTIVHEHLHVGTMPYHQVLTGRVNETTFRLVDEQVIDHLCQPLARLIKPKLRGVWDMRKRLRIPRQRRYAT